jgi:hypothetical protein
MNACKPGSRQKVKVKSDRANNFHHGAQIKCPGA